MLVLGLSSGQSLGLVVGENSVSAMRPRQCSARRDNAIRIAAILVEINPDTSCMDSGGVCGTVIHPRKARHVECSRVFDSPSAELECFTTGMTIECAYSMKCAFFDCFFFPERPPYIDPPHLYERKSSPDHISRHRAARGEIVGIGESTRDRVR